jgi:hypothetical protein
MELPCVLGLFVEEWVSWSIFAASVDAVGGLSGGSCVP